MTETILDQALAVDPAATLGLLGRPGCWTGACGGAVPRQAGGIRLPRPTSYWGQGTRWQLSTHA
jgi:hypothetical protein